MMAFQSVAVIPEAAAANQRTGDSGKRKRLHQRQC